MYRYTVTVDGRQVVFDDEGNILQGKRIYASLDEDTKKFIAPDLYTLTRGIDKCAIDRFSMSLLPHK